MSEANEGSMAGDQLRVRMTEMAALLAKRAPNLCPNVAPRQYKMAASDVLSICGTPKQRADAQAFLESKEAEITRDHERDNEEEDEEEGRTDGEKGGERHMVLKTETDFGTRTFRIVSAEVTIIVRVQQHTSSSTAAAALDCCSSSTQPSLLFGVHMHSLGRTVVSLLSMNRHLACPPFVPRGDKVICAHARIHMLEFDVVRIPFLREDTNSP